MTETRNLSFADQVVDVAVIPGNNWTIVVTVHSSGRISEIAEGRVSSSKGEVLCLKVLVL